MGLVAIETPLHASKRVNEANVFRQPNSLGSVTMNAHFTIAQLTQYEYQVLNSNI